MTTSIFHAHKLGQEVRKQKEAGNTSKAREVKTEWARLRDTLSGIEKDRFIHAFVEGSIDLPGVAWELMKEQNPVAYEVHLSLTEKS